MSWFYLGLLLVGEVAGLEPANRLRLAFTNSATPPQLV